MNIIQIEDLHFAYPEEEGDVLRGVNLRLEEGKFYILCGKSGCGKSTLLRHMKSALMPKGKRCGRLWKGVAEEEIGFVFQHPDNQIVTDKVWHELVFGMENLGYDQNTMNLRVAELASYFGMEHWFDKEVSQLSGGQKQLLNLAAVLTLRPKLLLLDEPMAWLDPMASTEFLHTLNRIQKELGMTVLLSAHQLEDVISYGDELLLMEEGQILLQGSTEKIGRKLRDRGEAFYMAMPVPMRIYLESGSEKACPCTIAEGREWLRGEMGERRESSGEKKKQTGWEKNQTFHIEDKENFLQKGRTANPVLRAKNLWYRYPGSDNDILCGTSFQVREGEILGILGGNGSGKSTLLKVMAGLLSAAQGKTQIQMGKQWVACEKGISTGEVAFLPQDVTTIFLEETVEQELTVPGKQKEKNRWIDIFELAPILKRHPYDISGGEKQKVAIVKLLLREGRLLLLDEPTNGMDAADKKRLGEVLQQLAKKGITIVMVSHDLEFTAAYAHRAGMFFRGKLEGLMPVRDFFVQNHFYTTAAHRMSRELIPEAVTVEDVLAVLAGENLRCLEQVKETGEQRRESLEKIEKKQQEKKSDMFLEDFQESKHNQGKSKGMLLYLAGIFLLYPVLLWMGMNFFHDRRYLLISMGMVVYALLPFFCLWEKRPPRVQKLVVLSVLTAIAVTGRCAFYMLPSVKPMAAIAIVAGISMGAESGFFVGAMSMLVSNMMFGQGPWTPWQMLAMGLVGLFAGLLMHRDRFLRRSTGRKRICMAIYGMFSVICMYGGIMNPASLLMASYELNLQNLLAIYLSGLPMDLVHGGTTGALLLIAGIPILKKLDRMKKKYELE